MLHSGKHTECKDCEISRKFGTKYTETTSPQPVGLSGSKSSQKLKTHSPLSTEPAQTKFKIPSPSEWKIEPDARMAAGSPNVRIFDGACPNCSHTVRHRIAACTETVECPWCEKKYHMGADWFLHPGGHVECPVCEVSERSAPAYPKEKGSIDPRSDGFVQRLEQWAKLHPEEAKNPPWGSKTQTRTIPEPEPPKPRLQVQSAYCPVCATKMVAMSPIWMKGNGKWQGASVLCKDVFVSKCPSCNLVIVSTNELEIALF
jgi:hypothetical protein